MFSLKFVNIQIPYLVQVIHFERDIKKAKSGAGDELIYKTITGLDSDLTVSKKPEILTNSKHDDDESNDSEDSSAEDSDDDQSDKERDDYKEMNGFKDSSRPRDESPESKKLRKKAVKDAKADKRKLKVKKHVKKRKEKQATLKKK